MSVIKATLNLLSYATVRIRSTAERPFLQVSLAMDDSILLLKSNALDIEIESLGEEEIRRKMLKYGLKPRGKAYNVAKLKLVHTILSAKNGKKKSLKPVLTSTELQTFLSGHCQELLEKMLLMEVVNLEDVYRPLKIAFGQKVSKKHLASLLLENVFDFKERCVQTGQ